MRARVVAFAALLLGASPAMADRAIGLVTFGDAATTGPLAQRVEVWLRGHGHDVQANPLAAEAETLIRDCLLLDDQLCARDVIAHQARTTSVLIARAEPGTHGEVALSLYWFTRERPAARDRRTCDACTPDRLAGLADEMLGRLATGRGDVGKLVLRSSPAGLTVRLDGVVIGVTPLERELPAGEHQVALERAGMPIDQRTIEISVGQTVTVDPTPSEQTARVLPITLVGGGAVAVAVGATFYYYGNKRGPEEKYVYDDTRAIGAITGAVGLGAMVTGALLYRRGGERSQPVMAVTSKGGYVGWAGRF